ncbi:acyl-CoA dehydrogenase family protein [Actinophytocola oryzae]|uniref:Acyl-CoA dehydrogenase n=1 Tax=Actinophytocola oryzae TaxID=502181 RepID=A0A4R7W3L4_9PSEU|nr:acyl-CoA dehydrogenase family protein [Actinophytocola oryzae]TDV56529.1 acyl-CoA dehydrogenase [Actinophytocola oryzae]
MLEPTDEQLAFKAEVRRYLERAWPTTVSRVAVEGGPPFDTTAWAGLARMGATGLLVPAEYGGAGASVVEAAFVCEELGRLVVAAPYLSSAVLAARLLTGLGGEVAERYLPGIADGTTVATVAFLDDHGRWNPDGLGVHAENGRLTGRVAYVTDLPSADLVLVVAPGRDGLGVYPVAPDAPGVTVGTLDCLDRTQPVGALRLDDVVVEGAAIEAEVVAEVVGVAIACLAASQVGGAERCLDLSVSYATQRVQFGRIIGSYQAIKHRCADMLARVESARSAAHHLIDAVATGEDVPVAASLAKAFCSDAYVACAGDLVQIHGGIGFTWEHDAHLYLKRAKASAHLFGDPTHHRDLLARHLSGR